MKLTQRPDLGHLTYCMNMQRGEAWLEVAASLERYLPQVKGRVAAARALALGFGSRRSRRLRCASPTFWRSRKRSS
jgi:hypothetical protein